MPSRVLLFTLLIAFLPGSAVLAQKPETSGVFIDSAGKRHPWLITQTHALLWDQHTYVPIGGTFTPRYLAEAATEENWQKDTQALATLKAKGIQDVLIKPIASAVHISPAVWQRLIDYLDAQGFRYGIAFGAGVTTPLTGTVVKPANYRIAGVTDNVEVTWNLNDALGGRYVLADPNDASTIVQSGDVRVEEGRLIMPAVRRVGRASVALLYPRKQFKLSREGGLADLWAGYDAYRDHLLNTLGKVKFGAGLRFFLDPLGPPLAIEGEVDYCVPDSPAFRLEWEAFLTRKYNSLDNLMNQWRMTTRNLKDFQQAARLIPLWAGSRGVAFLMDTASGAQFPVQPEASRFWSDLRQYRTESITEYMNGIADLLKREIAHVPVIFTRTHLHRIFTNTNRSGGFDGLGIAAYGRGSALVTGGADSVLSQCEESAKTMWCLVTETLDSASLAGEQTGYASQQALSQDLDWLRSIGAKGFFLNGFQVLPEAEYPGFQLLRTPEQIDWLKAYANRLTGELDLARSQPRTLFFPESAAGLVRAGPIGNGGVWWVPSLAPGKPMRFGSSYAGYTLTLPEGELTVLWSLRGTRETHLLVADPRRVEVTTADGLPIKGKAHLKGRVYTVVIGEAPVVIHASGQEIFPLEAVEDAIAQLKALVARALEAKLPAEQFKFMLQKAETNYRLKEPRMAYLIAQSALDGLVGMIQPYTWLEGEMPEAHTFTETVANDAASGSMYLLLNTETPPTREGYGVRYKFSVPADDVYTLWIACTPPGPHASPFVWLVDTEEPHSSSEATVVGAPYLANQFIWMNLGRVSLKAGLHTLTFRITDRAPAAKRYYLAIDALILTRSAFSPNGTARPSLAAVTETLGKGKK
jgi:hypothetical protein